VAAASSLSFKGSPSSALGTTPFIGEEEEEEEKKGGAAMRGGGAHGAAGPPKGSGGFILCMGVCT
jgi:hypothetical protein